MTTIRLTNVSIDIPVYNFANISLRKALLGKTIGGRFAQSGAHVIVNALRDISFTATDGDRIGLIGSNGAGKTTLLRVLAGVYTPISGSCEVLGDVVPLLDTSLGMNGDATGLESIRICGALWGLPRQEMEALLDDIAAFTELGDYLTMPIRTYSTGMRLRLAFAVATARKPDILLLDEVIGVGDANFYMKAFDRLLGLVQQSRVLVVASHSTRIIRDVCNKAIWLDQGGLVAYGPVEEVLAAYERGTAPAPVAVAVPAADSESTENAEDAPAEEAAAPATEPDPALEVGPIADIPWPEIDLAASDDPVPALMAHPGFAPCAAYFAAAPSARRSLLSDTAQALLFATIRNLRPDHVVEIGTFKGGTTEGLARAVQANGHGLVHTVSPYDIDRFRLIESLWPAELRAQVRYHPIDSMAFFMAADHERIRPGIVLVDGAHDYEFASFDIEAAARRLQPGGFLFIDNVSQAGPYFAARDFLARNPEWRDCAVAPPPPSDTQAFDRARTTIPGTDFFVLRAPRYLTIEGRPKSFGEIAWSGAAIDRLKLTLAQTPEPGTVRVQCVLRAFSETRQAEIVGEGSCHLGAGETEIEVPLTQPLHVAGSFDRYAVEPWLLWGGSQALALRQLPEPL